jgi:hypothetical protein
MGVLVKVENGDKQFWEEKFHAANEKAQHALKVPCFFLLSFGAGRGRRGGGGGSQQVPNVFPIAPCFNSLRFAQSPPLLTYICGPRGGTPSFHRIFYLGSVHSFNFSFCDGPIKFNQKKLDLWGAKLRQKMVMNSFRKRSFVQRLARPKQALKVPCILSF